MQCRTLDTFPQESSSMCPPPATSWFLAQYLPIRPESMSQRSQAQAGWDVHVVSAHHRLLPCVLTRLLPILQMAPSEGTVTQIGLLSQDIHRLTVGLCSSPHIGAGSLEARRRAMNDAEHRGRSLSHP
jgi:hypothetical protein